MPVYVNKQPRIRRRKEIELSGPLGQLDETPERDRPPANAGEGGREPDAVVERAIEMHSKFFDLRQLQQSQFNKADLFYKAYGSGGGRARNPYLVSNHPGSVNKSIRALNAMREVPILGGNGAAKLRLSRQAVAAMNRLEREDLFDSLLEVRADMNKISDENTRVRTRNAILLQQLKAKNRFIDELLKSTRALGGATAVDEATAGANAAVRMQDPSPPPAGGLRSGRR